MPSYSATTLVLHRSDFGEHDRIVTLYAREAGKISAIAKGSRRPSSRLSGATELFMQARVQLATGKSLDILTQCEIQQSFSGLRTDLQMLARATYFCELLDRFTGSRDAASCDELFDLTIASLSLLQQCPAYPDAAVHAYELKLLTSLGYAPVIDRCVCCGAALKSAGAGFSAALGGVVCPSDRFRAPDTVSISNEAVLIMLRLQREELGAASAISPSSKAAAELAKALRWFVRFRAERNMKTADFLDHLRASG